MKDESSSDSQHKVIVWSKFGIEAVRLTLGARCGDLMNLLRTWKDFWRAYHAYG